MSHFSLGWGALEKVLRELMLDLNPRTFNILKSEEFDPGFSSFLKEKLPKASKIVQQAPIQPSILQDSLHPLELPAQLSAN